MVPFDDLTVDILPPLRVRFEMPVSDLVERTDREVPGDPAVPVRVHRAKGADGVLPCVYSMHGGGYVLGTNLMDDMLFDELCPKLGVVGVSVDYRLAPETPYPGPLEDCYRGLQWTYEHADELGIDPSRIGVMGVSAGGGLAAALCLLARDRGEIPVAFQLLDQPMLDDRQITPSSREDGLAVWSRDSNTFGWKAYLGDLYGRDDVPPTAAPARATDLSGLPPDLRVGRRGRRLPRRRRRLRDAAEPGRRADRAPRVPGRVSRLQRHGARTPRSRSSACATWSTGWASSSRGRDEPGPGAGGRGPVPPGAGAPSREVHRDLGRRPRRRAAAHVRGTTPRRAAGPRAADRRDAPRPPGVGVRGTALHARSA